MKDGYDVIDWDDGIISLIVCDVRRIVRIVLFWVFILEY